MPINVGEVLSRQFSQSRTASSEHTGRIPWYLSPRRRDDGGLTTEHDLRVPSSEATPDAERHKRLANFNQGRGRLSRFLVIVVAVVFARLTCLFGFIIIRSQQCRRQRIGID